MKIDIFPHILPTKYKEALYKVAPSGFYLQNVIDSTPTLFDLEHRLRIMDKYEGLMQVLTLSSPQFMPLYEKMSQYNLPIWIHPQRAANYADYRTESRSRYMIFSNFGWPYETTVAMTRLVFSGVLEKYPNLKIISHHCGGMVPYFEQRIIGSYDHAEMLRGAKYKQGLTKPPIEYFKIFEDNARRLLRLPA